MYENNQVRTLSIFWLVPTDVVFVVSNVVHLNTIAARDGKAEDESKQ